MKDFKRYLMIKGIYTLEEFSEKVGITTMGVRYILNNGKTNEDNIKKFAEVLNESEKDIEKRLKEKDWTI